MKTKRPEDLVAVTGMLVRETRCRIKLQFADIRGRPRVVTLNHKFVTGVRFGNLIQVKIPRYIAYQNKLEV